MAVVNNFEEKKKMTANEESPVIVVNIRIESPINANYLKLILDKLQETGLVCNVSFSPKARIFIIPPKKLMRVERQDL